MCLTREPGAVRQKMAFLFNTPFAYKLSDALAAIGTMPLSKALSDFEDKFPKVDYTLQHDRIAAPMLPQHGQALVKPLWAKVISEEHLAGSCVDRLSTVAMKEWLCGWSKNAIIGDFEPEALATLTLHVKGKVQVVMMSATDALKLPAVVAFQKENPSASLADSMRDFMMKVGDQSTLIQMAELGVRGFHVTVDSKEAPIIYTPPGWFKMVKVLEETPAMAIRVSCLPKSAEALANIRAFACTPAELEIIQPWIDLIQVVEAQGRM